MTDDPEEQCPNGCPDGLSVNCRTHEDKKGYDQVIYCPECGWERIDRKEKN